jgi:hypothetical protein
MREQEHTSEACYGSIKLIKIIFTSPTLQMKKNPHHHLTDPSKIRVSTETDAYIYSKILSAFCV